MRGRPHLPYEEPARCKCGAEPLVLDRPKLWRRYKVICPNRVEHTGRPSKRLDKKPSGCLLSTPMAAVQRDQAIRNWNRQFLPKTKPVPVDLPRCKCGLLLPCDRCIPDIAEFARAVPAQRPVDDLGSATLHQREEYESRRDRKKALVCHVVNHPRGSKAA